MLRATHTTLHTPTAAKSLSESLSGLRKTTHANTACQRHARQHAQHTHNTQQHTHNTRRDNRQRITRTSNTHTSTTWQNTSTGQHVQGKQGRAYQHTAPKNPLHPPGQPAHAHDGTPTHTSSASHKKSHKATCRRFRGDANGLAEFRARKGGQLCVQESWPSQRRPPCAPRHIPKQQTEQPCPQHAPAFASRTPRQPVQKNVHLTRTYVYVHM